MSQTLKVNIASEEGRELWIPCSSCGKVTCHRPLRFVATSDVSPDDSIQVWDEYYIVQCAGCRNVCFCTQSRCTEDSTFDPRTGDETLNVTTRVYPGRIAGRFELEHAYLLPFPVNRVYSETWTALANDQPVLAGVGIRAIVETVCKERCALGRNLMEKIDDLAAKGVVTHEGAQILHSLRFMGNDAAHEVKAHSEEELMTALDVLEYLLKGVYILPKLAQKLPQGVHTP